jgi:uncharacterized phiE125 gp8 family phage protein
MSINYDSVFDYGYMPNRRLRKIPFSLACVTDPTSEPVTTTECKAAARITNSEEDAYVANLITGVRKWCEDYTERAFMTQTWRLGMDGVPAHDTIHIPRLGLKKVNYILSYDVNNAPATMSASMYYVDVYGNRILLNDAQQWPQNLRKLDALVINFDAGFGATASLVPQVIRNAIKVAVAYTFEHRGDEKEIGGRVSANAQMRMTFEIPDMAKQLLAPWARPRI